MKIHGADTQQTVSQIYIEKNHTTGKHLTYFKTVLQHVERVKPEWTTCKRIDIL